MRRVVAYCFLLQLSAAVWAADPEAQSRDTQSTDGCIRGAPVLECLDSTPATLLDFGLLRIRQSLTTIQKSVEQQTGEHIGADVQADLDNWRLTLRFNGGAMFHDLRRATEMCRIIFGAARTEFGVINVVGEHSRLWSLMATESKEGSYVRDRAADLDEATAIEVSTLLGSVPESISEQLGHQPSPGYGYFLKCNGPLYDSSFGSAAYNAIYELFDLDLHDRMTGKTIRLDAH